MFGPWQAKEMHAAAIALLLFGVSIRRIVLFRSLGRAENRIGATAQQDVHVRTLIIVIAVQITQLCSLIPTCCSDVSVSQDRVIKMKHQSITRSEKNSITASQF